MTGRIKTAVVGGGVAGIVAAYLLQEKQDVTLFEKNDYLGGHTHTIEVPDGPDAGLPVDTGFIVLNDKTYPLFETFLDRLGIATRISEMSFSLDCRRSDFLYGGSNLNGLFAQRRNLFNLRFYRFLFEIAAFCRQAQLDLDQNAVGPVTLDAYLLHHRRSDDLKQYYLAPMAAAIWSTPATKTGDFPARAFLEFFRNHGLLSLRNRPIWRTVVGGSHAYVKQFCKTFRGRIVLNCGIRSLARDQEQVRLRKADGSEEFFDRVVIATHADQALKLLADPSEQELRLLTPWRYQINRTILHTDSSLLPARQNAWCAWNFRRDIDTGDERPVYVTYYMNRLQGFESARHYCVTLNHEGNIDPAHVIAEMDYHHPLYDFDSMATQSDLPTLNGQQNTWFCGSYFGYGFHEDAVRSAVAVGKAMGIEL